MAAVLETQNLTYVYSPGSPFARTAVDHVNISIEEGEFVGVIQAAENPPSFSS